MEGGAIHCRITNLSAKGENGKVRSAVAKAAYNCGRDLWIEKQQRTTNLKPRHDVVHTALYAPDGAPDWTQDREALWNKVELTAKRKDARYAKNIQLAITRGIPPEQWPEMLREYVMPFVELGHIVDVALHDDDVSDNPHAHLMLTVNTLTPTGFGKKIDRVDQKAFVPNARKRWADITNNFLIHNGLPIKVSHKSYAALGIQREPTKHRGANRRERAQKHQRANAHLKQEQTMNVRETKQSHIKATLDVEPYEDNMPFHEPEPAKKDWFDNAYERVQAEQRSANNTITDEDLRDRTGLTVESEAERQLLLSTQNAPTAIRVLVETELAHQQDQRQVAKEQEARLEVLAEHLTPDQQQALNTVLEENARQQPPYPEPGPHHEPYSQSELKKAREHMVEEYERE